MMLFDLSKVVEAIKHFKSLLEEHLRLSLILNEHLKVLVFFVTVILHTCLVLLQACNVGFEGFHLLASLLNVATKLSDLGSQRLFDAELVFLRKLVLIQVVCALISLCDLIFHLLLQGLSVTTSILKRYDSMI